MDWSLVERGAMQQARCPECNVALDGVSRHDDGCEYNRRYQEGALNSFSAILYRELQHAYLGQQTMNISIETALKAKPGDLIPIPEPEPRKWTWGDLLIEGVREDLRRFGDWLRNWLP